MKITIWPTPLGRCRSPGVVRRVFEYLKEGKEVVLAMRDDPAFIALDANVDDFLDDDDVIWVRRVNDWKRMPKFGAGLVVFDCLYLGDETGSQIVSLQETPEREAVTVPTKTILPLLEDLQNSGVEEVYLVLINDEISQTWIDHLSPWNVSVHPEDEDENWWRSWIMTRDDPENDPLLVDADREKIGENTALASAVHSRESQLLISLSMEYSDLEYGAGDPQRPRNYEWMSHPVLLLQKLLKGVDDATRQKLLEKLHSDLSLLAHIVDGYRRNRSFREDTPLGDLVGAQVPYRRDFH